MCLSDEAGTRRCRNLISEREMITAAGGCTHSSWNTLDSLSKGYVTSRAPPFGEKRGERKSRAWKAGCHKMPQKRVKYYMARVALIGQVRWRGQRGTVTRNTCVDQRMRVLRIRTSGRSVLKRGYVSRYKHVRVCTYSGWARRKGYIDVQL